MKKVYIYTLSSSENPSEIRYVGKTHQPVFTRLKQHKKETKCNLKNNWIKSVLKKGFDIVIDVVDECTEETWMEKEKFWIKYYKDLGFNLKNMTEGGETSSIKGENHPQFGKIGKNNQNYKGKDYKIRATTSKRNSGNKKAVDMIDAETGEILKTFPSANEAALFIKGNRNNIGTVCRGKRCTYQGYIWKYSKKEYFPVKQYKDGILVNEFRDFTEASVLTGINHTNIVRSSKTHLKANGFKWIYTYDNTGDGLRFQTEVG